MSSLTFKSELQSAAANALVEKFSLERRCVGCNCTDSNPCIDDYTGEACSWVPDREMDVCSFCAAIAIEAAIAERDERNEPAIQLYSPHGAQRYIEETRVMRAGGGL